MNAIMLFSGNPTATNRTFSLDTQRQILDNMVWVTLKTNLQVQHDATEGNRLSICRSKDFKKVRMVHRAYLLLTAWMIQRLLH